MKEEKKITPDIIARYKEFMKSNPQFMREKAQQKYTAYIHIVLSLITVSFFGIFAINPTISTIFNLQKKLEDNQVVYDGLKQKLQSLDTLSKQYKSLEPKLSFIDSAVPSSTEIPKLTRQLELLAASRQLTIDKLDFGQVEIYPANKTTPPVFSFTFNLSIRGEETQIKNFIYDIIAFDRIINLEKVTTGSGNSGSNSSFIIGRAYYQTKE